jgi:tetratricopeptide (TPR) repeat protein
MLDLLVLGRVCQDGEDGAAEGLAALALVGLITVSPGSAGTRSGVTVHRLLTETSRLRLDDEDPAQAGGVAVALLATAAAGLGHDRREDWDSWVQLGPHVNAVYGYLAGRLAGDDLAALADVTASVAQAFLSAGSYLAAQQLAESALQYAARLGADHAAVLALRFQVATAHLYRGEYAEAEQEFRDLLAARLRVLGPDHPDTMTAMHEIAGTLGARGRYKQAEQEYREVLAAALRILGPDHHDTLVGRYGVARMLAKRGQSEQAEQELQEVLGAQIRVLGPGHPDTRVTRDSLTMLESQTRPPS